MGVKDLWTVITPYAERKPIYELRGKIVAIDLAGWVCESLNVVDYFVHPRHHLKNLFFRTCYLIWEQVTPVFVLDGVAPKLKNQVMAKRNEIQFRGVRPKDKVASSTQNQESQPTQTKKKEKGRTRFNHVLKQCETLLHAMGIQCIQAPGEAEAYCAFLNKKGLVDGVISQDSDCFAYGAIRVYRNFSVSTQGTQAAAGGAVDIYDMRQICKQMDFGQHKIIVMALICGCDYCPEGVGGVGRDSVVKLFNKYKDVEILKRIRSWRQENDKYNELEMRVDDKNICSNCGHLGRTQSHTKSGCGVCRTNRGCDENLWKDERLSLKAELSLRKKALLDPEFPSAEIIEEFLNEPSTVPNLNLNWRQPNIIKFIKQIGPLLQWPEIYSFQKFFPLLTRWQVQNPECLNQPNRALVIVEPQEIIKKRTVKSVPSLELRWRDTHGCFNGLIPDDQLKEFELEQPKGREALYCTIEPLCMLEIAYPEIVASFLKSKEKPIKVKKTKNTKKNNANAMSLENMSDLLAATDEIAEKIKKTTAKRKKKPAVDPKKGLQLIDKFLKKPQKIATPVKVLQRNAQQCSTPITKSLASDLESDCDADAFDMSDIINGIVTNPKAVPIVTQHAGRLLRYEIMQLHDKTPTLDDADLLTQKRNLSFCNSTFETKAKRLSLDDSFDLLVKGDHRQIQELMQKSSKLLASSSPLQTHVDRFKQQQCASDSYNKSIILDESVKASNVSYFFDQSNDVVDAFEQFMDTSMARQKTSSPLTVCNELVVISSDTD